MTLETVLAGGEDRSLKLQDHFVTQTRGIRHVASSTADSGKKPLVSIQAQRNLMRKAGHG